MGSPTHYACYRKKMLGWICEKMATRESVPRGDRFFAFSSTIAKNGTSACNDPCAPCRDYSTNQLGGRGPTPSRFSPTQCWVKKRWRIICGWVSLKSSLLTARSKPTCRQDTYASRVCRTRAKATYVTSIVFNWGKLWLGFGVATHNLR